MAIDNKYGQITTELVPGNPFSEDEPVFLIRARDDVAVDIVDNYLLMQEKRPGNDPSFLDSIRRARNGIMDWQIKNSDLVKRAD